MLNMYPYLCSGFGQRPLAFLHLSPEDAAAVSGVCWGEDLPE